jgi:hypothetical protein
MGIYLYSRIPNTPFEWKIESGDEFDITGRGFVLVVDSRFFTRREQYCPFRFGDFVTYKGKRYCISGIEWSVYNPRTGLRLVEVRDRSHEYRLRRQTV